MIRSARGVGAAVLCAISVLAACDTRDARIGSMNPAVAGSSGTDSIAAGAAGEESSVGGTGPAGSGGKVSAGSAGTAGLGASGSGTATGGGGSGAGAGASAGGGGKSGASEGGKTGASGAAGQEGGAGAPLGGLSLLAGGLGARGNVDGTGPAARFKSPYGIAIDGAGYLFVADSENHTIRKIDSATGAVTTLAGAPGQYGNVDGNGAAARFQAPFGIASDGAGNLYISDNGNNAIRKLVVASGAVTTLVGTEGHLNAPGGIVSDGTGNLYVSDTNNHTIRKVVIASGAVSTLAGTAGQWGTADGVGAAARFFYPGGMVSDGAGNLYVADIDNYAIRKIVIATGEVTTFAGAPGELGNVDGMGTAAHFSFPTDIAGDGAGNLYVADNNNQTIRKIVIATGEVTTFAGAVGQEGSTDGTGPDARFRFPWGMTSDGAGNLYVVDTNNDTIRKVVIGTATVTTVAGAARHGGSVDGTGAAARFEFPRGMVSDGAGNLYVADGGNNTIRKIAIATGVVTTLAGAAGVAGSADGIGAGATFSGPIGIAGDGAGNLYVVDGGNSTIRKIDIATGTVSTLAGAAGQWAYADGPGVDARFYFPTGIASDPGGYLYVVDSTTIRQVVMATGAVTTVAPVPGRSPEDAGPPDIVSDGAGSLYIADFGVVRKVDIATGTMSTFAGSQDETGTTDGTGAAARFSYPKGLASDGAGNLYVADGNTIRKIVIATATVSTVVGTPAGVGVTLGPLPASLNSPYGIVVLSAEELAIVDNAENAVMIGHL